MPADKKVNDLNEVMTHGLRQAEHTHGPNHKVRVRRAEPHDALGRVRQA
jgi:hypothetical protein